MQKMVIIVGPTAVGKSALAVWLARKCNGEVVSADSRQVYRNLDIGTGKITTKDMCGVPHHLLDVASPRGQFSVARYVTKAHRAIRDIARRGKLPILCGGTGLYIYALLGTTPIPEVPPDKVLRRRLEKKSTLELFAMLKKLDSRRARTIDRHNPRRLVRAIEIAKALGKVPNIQPTTNDQQQKILWIGLTLAPEELKHKIAIRLFARISEQGMLAEAKQLHRQGLSWKRMEALGLEYRYLARFLQKKLTRDGMVGELEKESWRYARRQMTWFKRNKEIQWFSPRETRKIGRAVSSFLRA